MFVARPPSEFMSEPQYIFRCCLCHKDGTLGLKIATLIRLDCVKHGHTLHHKLVKRTDGGLEPAEA